MIRNLYLAGIFLALTIAASKGNAQSLTASNELPETPAAQQAQTPSPQTQQPAAAPALDPPAAFKPPQPQTSQEQLQQEEKQRILGIMPTFNVTNNQNALPLTPGQKFQLFFKGSTDPWNFGLAAFQAGLGQAENDPIEYGQGIEGYAKRFSSNYLDTFDGNLWGNAILPSWWHEDPRYYRKGSGSFIDRFGWAAASTVWCKRDNGTWGPNYANVVGNDIGAGIANLYYPASERNIEATLRRGSYTTVYGAIGAEFVEFWPDVANHYLKARREKKARQEAQQDAQQADGQSKP